MRVSKVVDSEFGTDIELHLSQIECHRLLQLINHTQSAEALARSIDRDDPVVQNTIFEWVSALHSHLQVYGANADLEGASPYEVWGIPRPQRTLRGGFPYAVGVPSEDEETDEEDPDEASEEPDRAVDIDFGSPTRHRR